MSTGWACRHCDWRGHAWHNKCPKCGRWHTVARGWETEDVLEPRPMTEFAELPEPPRRGTGIPGVDRVLGGGLVVGSSVLLAGDPGAGKSTLLMQATTGAASRSTGRVLYVTGEEQEGQVALRAARVGRMSPRVDLAHSTDATQVASYTAHRLPEVLVVDSIQTMHLETVAAAVGSVQQVQACAALLCTACREAGTCLVMIGHVTKDGNLAGPKTLEHLVDVVLTLEVAEGGGRLLRATKNRYGSTLEVAEFTMTEGGLR